MLTIMPTTMTSDLTTIAGPRASQRTGSSARLTVLIAACAALTFGCTRQPPQTGPSTAARAALLNPADRFWGQHAPPTYYAHVETSKGTFVIEVDRSWAPRGADRFYNLARAGYYDDTRFTRIVPNYIAQFGIARDSTLNALWHAAYFADDSGYRHNARGTIGFAATGPGARTTQLYINLVDNARVDPQGLGPIGRVVSGMDVVDALYSGYGENSGGGVRAGKQGPLWNGGNAYIDREYPKLDRLIRIVVSDRP